MGGALVWVEFSNICRTDQMDQVDMIAGHFVSVIGSK